MQRRHAYCPEAYMDIVCVFLKLYYQKIKIGEISCYGTKLSKEANCKLTEGQFEEILLEFPRENGFDKSNWTGDLQCKGKKIV